MGAATTPPHPTPAPTKAPKDPLANKQQSSSLVVRGSFFRHQDFTDTVTKYVVAVGRVGVAFRPKQHMVMHLGSRHWDKEF